MHEHKHNQCRRKVKHRKNVMKLIIFCITVGISLMFIYYQNSEKRNKCLAEMAGNSLDRRKKVDS